MLLILATLTPLISGIVSRLGDFINIRILPYISIALIIFASCCGVMVFCHAYNSSDIQYLVLFDWIQSVNINISWSIYVDRLTALMLVVVLLVSAVVHIYSIGYMHDGRELCKFISYLSFFTFFMLMLITANNFLQLFCGWEGVGAMSYLLIGFWHDKHSANIAAYKAFIVNRLADCAFILAMIIIFYNCNSLIFNEVFSRYYQLTHCITIFDIQISIIEIVCFLLFVACMAKSAQIGLHVWLPDAMEGPTPASALIHAATMVTAGVFLLARCSFLFSHATNTSIFIAAIGGITCIVTAIAAVLQDDIKKVIAYSTCSQIGYMVMGCGVLCYNGAIFHLFTHAFFKSMLFLAAGNIIHITHQQSLSNMPQQLWQSMPYTYILFVVGCLSIVGIYPFSGHYSKDLILEAVYLSNNKLIYFLGIISVFFTALYSTRLIATIFHSHAKLERSNSEKYTDASLIMQTPLVLLLTCSIAAGWYGTNILNINCGGYFGNSLSHNFDVGSTHISLIIQLLPTCIAVLGIATGYIMYKYNSSTLTKIMDIIKNMQCFNRIYHCIFVNYFRRLAYLLNIVDTKFSHYTSKSIMLLTSGGFQVVRKIQSGHLLTYMLVSLATITIFLTFFVINYFVIGV